jgi:hypothetical protein
MKKRYKLTKEQLERVVESYITEAAAPEATKHIISKEGGDKMVEKRSNTKTPPENDSDGIDDVNVAPEAKKHIKNKMDGKMVEKRTNTKAPAQNVKFKKPHAPEAKKHIRQK